MIDIEKILRQQGLKNNDLVEEYADHYCCLHESNIQQGITSKESIQLIKTEISKIDFKEINQNHFILHNKKHLYVMATIFMILIANFIFTIQPIDPPTIAPIAYQSDDITSHFGMRTHPTKKVKKLHTGIDIKASIGTLVVAPSDGIIADAGYHKGNGYYIEIKHDKEYSTRYHHLSEITITKGQKIEKGNTIGKVGSSGLSTAPHLHYEVIRNGKKVDPRDYLKV